MLSDAPLQARRDGSWTDELIEALAATGAVDSVDFKAHYPGRSSIAPDGALSRHIVAGYPDAWLEDPGVESPETAAPLPASTQRSPSAPRSTENPDIEALPFPRALST